MNKAHGFMLIGAFLLILILATSFASANTLVGGKIYDSDYSDVIGGANVSVQCGSEILDTASLSDGTYAVVFSNTGSCYASSKVKVIAFKGDLSGGIEAIINNSTEEGEGEEFFAVPNINLKAPSTPTIPTTPTSGGGGGGITRRIYLCGNGICNSGETSQTCLKDCPIVIEEISENETSTELINLSSNTENTSSVDGNLGNEETQNTENSHGITGRVIDIFGKTGNIILILVFALFLVIVITVISSIRKRKKRLMSQKTPTLNYSETFHQF
jgi:hypothetical protein